MAWSLFKTKPKKEPAPPPASNESILPDDKQSLVVVQTSRINTILVAVGALLITAFLISLFFIGGGNKRGPAPPPVEESDSLPEAPRIPPSLTSSPQNISMSGDVGEETAFSISLSVSNAPAQITSVELSAASESISIDNDCVSRGRVDVDSGCTVNIFYAPSKPGNRNIFINVVFIDPAERDGSEKTFRIPLSLSARASPTDAYDEQEEEEYDDEDDDDDEEDDFVPAQPQPKQRVEPQPAVPRTSYPDCRKYATKAYDFAGVFLGWVQNQDVFAPNCSVIIGRLRDNGIVEEAGTGRIIGRSAVPGGQRMSDDERINLILPEIADATRPPPQADIADIMANREEVRGSGGGMDLIGNRRADDPLGLFDRQRSKFVPQRIADTQQNVSSDPKDERYVLRQTKPIPAVLVRPIYFPGTESINEIGQENFQGPTERFDAVATVERNVYGGDGRTIVVPTGSMLIGQAERPEDVGMVAIQKINIKWTRLIRPDGAEFDLEKMNVDAYTADAQGRYGVAGKNDTEYMRDLLLRPLLYSALPVAMESLFPTTSNIVTRVRRSDGNYQVLDDNALVGGGDTVGRAEGFGFDLTDSQSTLNMSSRDKMKVEIQQNWKTVANRMLERSLQSRVPFTIPAGTRIQVYLNDDVMLRIGADDEMFGQE